MNKKLPTVFYIVGAGSSGSTLLSVILGAHERSVSVGELNRYDEYHLENGVCTCNHSFSDCELWSEVSKLEEYSDDAFKSRLSPLFNIWSFLFLGNQVFQSTHYFKEIVERNLKLYRNISKAACKDLIVDSSKDLPRLLFLNASGAIKLVPVFISRHGQSYIHSKNKRGGGSFFAMLRWIRLNLEAHLVWRRIRGDKRGVRLSYLSLLNDPKKITDLIFSLSDVDDGVDIENFNGKPQHNIAGSPSRFDFESIKSVDESINKISSKDKVVFFILGGTLWNRIFKVNKIL